MNTSTSAQRHTLESGLIAILNRNTASRAQDWSQFLGSGTERRKRPKAPVLMSRPTTTSNAARLAVPARAKDEGEGESDLGRRLRAIRAEIVAAGEPLLTWDELERELAELRGEE